MKLQEKGVPLLECLEQRLLLTGDVTAIVARNGDLVINVIGAAGIMVSQPGGNYQVSPLDGDTTINGLLAPTGSLPVTRRLIINIDASTGSQVQLLDLTVGMTTRTDVKITAKNETSIFINGLICKNFSFKTAGSSTVTVDDGTGGWGSSIQGNLTVTGGKFDDSVSLYGVQVSGKATVSLGASATVVGNLFVAMSSTNNICRFDNNLTVKGGTGGDQVNIVQASLADPNTIAGNLSVSLGGGLNQLTMLYANVFGSLTYSGGNGDDNLSLQTVYCPYKQTIKLGNGNNSLMADDCDMGLYKGPFSVTSGSGIDTITLDALTGTSRPNAFRSDLTVKLGAGNDTLTVGADFAIDPNCSNSIYGKTTFDGGSGINFLDNDPSYGNYFEFLPRIKNFA